jgi:nucleoside-diphosphate-sugar epimerase
MFKKKKILITGGAGFIGQSLIDSREFDYISYDVVQDPIMDVLNFRKLMDILVKEEVDGILHLAAVSRVKTGHEYPDRCVDVNVKGTLNVLETAAEYQALTGKPAPFVIVASSREVYGTSYEPENRANEYSELKPMNIYAATKVMEENLAYAFNRNYGLSTAIVRFGGVYTNKYDHMDRVLPKFILAALKGEDLVVNGSVQLPFIHIDDTVKGLNILLKRMSGKENFHDAYLFATSETNDLEFLANLIVKKTESKSKVLLGQQRHYDVDKFYAEAHLTYNKLNWKPELDIVAGIERSIEVLRDLNGL